MIFLLLVVARTGDWLDLSTARDDLGSNCLAYVLMMTLIMARQAVPRFRSSSVVAVPVTLFVFVAIAVAIMLRRPACGRPDQLGGNQL